MKLLTKRGKLYPMTAIIIAVTHTCLMAFEITYRASSASARTTRDTSTDPSYDLIDNIGIARKEIQDPGRYDKEMTS